MNHKILKEGTHRGLKYFIRQIDRSDDYSPLFPLERTAWNVGYVEVPEHNEIYEKESLFDLFDLFDVHGGITFSDWSTRIKIGDGKMWLVGFDANHIGDSIIIQDEDFMEKECKRLAEQVVKHNTKCG